MNWNERWAGRTALMKRSAVRELLKVVNRPDVISLAGGLPATELFPFVEIHGAVRRALAANPAAALQYGETEGNAELRDWVAARYSCAGRPLTRGNVLITTGSQQALDLVGRVLLDDGAGVMVEDPAYLALLAAWRPLGVRFMPVPVDEEGIDLSRMDTPSVPPRMVYTVPNFQNPTGATMALERRRRAVEQIRSWKSGLLEDDPYGQLRYDGEAEPSLFELDAAAGDGAWHVLAVGSLSKVLAPGLRLGWVVGPEVVIDRLTRAKQAVDLHTGSLDQAIAVELIRSGVLETQVVRLREEYRRRRDALLDALAREFGEGARWTRPHGGMFVWVTLPAAIDTAALLPRALERGVAFVPGGEFQVNGGRSSALRLNFTHAAPARLAEAIARLGEAVRTGTPAA